MAESTSSVLIVGGGASAVFVTAALLQRASAQGVPAPAVTVVGVEPVVGLGIAYGRAAEHHRLNSPAGKMSVVAGDDLHFVRWCQSTGRDTAPGDFVERRVFGEYCASTFQGFLDAPGSTVSFVQGEVVDLVTAGGHATATLADGTTLAADTAVLALGTPAPTALDLGVDRRIDDPWAPGALDGIAEDDRVLLVGTGLTMIDVATSLARRFSGIRMVATSRHLYVPSIHYTQPMTLGPGLGNEVSTLGGMMKAFGAQVRAASAAGTPWEAVIDGMRPQIQALWMRLSTADQKRFLSHVARRWDTRRHRMAPAVGAELNELIVSGRLTLVAEAPRSEFDVAVNCTGPRSVAARGWSRLVDHLVEAGTVEIDPLGLGLAAEANGALHSADGSVDPVLYSIGTPIKGSLWESVAIGEIRLGAARIAESVLQPEAVSA